MNFNVDNLKEPGGGTPNKKKPNIAAVIIIIALIIICCSAAVMLIMSSTKNSSNNSPIETSTEDSVDFSVNNHISTILPDSNLLNSKEPDDNTIQYKTLELNMIYKISLLTYKDGLVDGTIFNENETFEDYITRIYNKDTKSWTEKFYCSLYEGEESVCSFIYDYLCEKDVINDNIFESYKKYMDEYQSNYFDERNDFSTNSDLKKECIEYLSNIKINSSGYIDFPLKDYFNSHIEDYSKFVPDGAEDFNQDRNGNASFKLDDGSGNLVRYYFHKDSDGEIYYSINKDNADDVIDVYNRFEKSDFVYYKESIKKANADTQKLLDEGYTWQKEDGKDVLVKSENGKTHIINLT